MKIIGLGHYSRTGKDTLANAIVKHAKVKVLKQPFAWKLKEIAADLYGWAGVQPPAYYDIKEHEHMREVKLPVLDMTPVELWVALGTPAIRQQVYDRTWIDYLLKSKHDAAGLVIPDVRFPNEVEAIREASGLVVKVIRPGFGPRQTVADLALETFQGWDNIVGGEGTMECLDRWGQYYAKWIEGTAA